MPGAVPHVFKELPYPVDKAGVLLLVDDDPLEGVEGGTLLEGIPQGHNLQNLVARERMQAQFFDLLAHTCREVFGDDEAEGGAFGDVGGKVGKVADALLAQKAAPVGSPRARCRKSKSLSNHLKIGGSVRTVEGSKLWSLSSSRTNATQDCAIHSRSSFDMPTNASSQCR